MRTPLALACLYSALLASPHARAQIGLNLCGGSVPGQLEMSAGPFVPDGRWGIVLISTQLASIPLWPLDPADTRSLGVGLELGSVSRIGLVNDGSGVFHGNPMTVPNQPNFIDGTLYFQSTYVPGNQRFFGPLSPVQAVRFGPANSFHSRGVQMTTARSFFPVVRMLDGRIMMPGGGAGALLAQQATSRADIYDPVTDTFEVYPYFMHSARSVHTASTLFDGRVLIVGGVDSLNDPTPSCEWFDPFIDGFISGPDMSEARMGHTSTSLQNGLVLVTGGMTDLNFVTSPLEPVFSTTKSTELFNLATNTWSPGPDMTVPRAGHTALTLPDGRVLLIGGISWFNFAPSVPIPHLELTTDIYDPLTNTIVPGPSMTEGRALFSASELGGGQFLIAGGLNNIILIPNADVLPTATAEIYDANTNSWSPASPMNVARAFAAVYPVDGGRLMHFGGGENSALDPVPLDTTEIYDPVLDQWTFGPTLPQPLAAFGSYVTESKQIHMLGGSGPGTPAIVPDTFWYYP